MKAIDVTIKVEELNNMDIMDLINVIDNPNMFARAIRTLSRHALNNDTTHYYLQDRGPLKMEFDTVVMDEANLHTNEIEFSFYNSKQKTGYDSNALAEIVGDLFQSMDTIEVVSIDVYNVISDSRWREEIVIRLAKKS